MAKERETNKVLHKISRILKVKKTNICLQDFNLFYLITALTERVPTSL